MSNTRRQLLEQSSTLAATASASWLFASEANADDKAKSDPNHLTVAVIGPGGMGMAHTNQLATNSAVRVAYVCDFDEQRAARAAEAVEKGSGKAPKVEKNMRQVLDDKVVKAVWIATPDHWHAPAAILAGGGDVLLA